MTAISVQQTAQTQKEFKFAILEDLKNQEVVTTEKRNNSLLLD